MLKNLKKMLFYSLKPKDLSFTVMNNKEKQQIFTFTKLIKMEIRLLDNLS